MYEQLNQRQESHFEKQDELTGKLYQAEHRVRELEFQLDLQRQEL